MRTFERTAQLGERARPGYSIQCSMCGDRGTVLAAGFSGNLPPEVVTKKLTQLGWTVGKKPKQDLCPACARRHIRLMAQTSLGIADEALKAGEIPPEVHQNVQAIGQAFINHLDGKETPPVSKPTLAAVPPRTMTRDDRRIIFEKLNEVYVNEKVGYSSGWSDKRVSEDLGVPQAWVAEIRDQNHGPDNASQEAREWAEKALNLEAKITDLSGEFAAKMAGFAQQLEALKSEARQLGKAGAHIQKQFR